MKRWIAAGICFGLVAMAADDDLFPAASAQSVYAYPTAGQSSEQQQRDQFDCHGWAVQQTRFDPYRAQPTVQSYYGAPPPSSSGKQGGVLQSAAIGAAGGAVIGAIAGNPGKGAAIGAVTGTLFGGIRRSNRRAQEEAYRQQQYAQAQYQQQQAQQQRQAQMRNYNRAYSACMSGRDYRVQ